MFHTRSNWEYMFAGLSVSILYWHFSTGRPCGNKIKVGTWNVRTLYQAGKLGNVIQEMGRLDVNIFGLCETRWTNSGSKQIDDYKIIYSGGDKHEKGVGIILD